jgi:hypothetical protein
VSLGNGVKCKTDELERTVGSFEKETGYIADAPKLLVCNAKISNYSRHSFAHLVHFKTSANALSNSKLDIPCRTQS